MPAHQQHPQSLFHEEQRVSQAWIWIVIMAASLLVVTIFGYGIFSQLVLDKPFGQNPMPDDVLIWFGPLMIAVGFAMPFFLRSVCLTTDVRSDGVYYQHWPVHRHPRKISLTEINTFVARQYAPIREFGGWGIRWWGSNGWAYSVSGNRGVQFTLKNGHKILIGSQKAEEFAAAISRYWSPTH